MFFFPYSSTLKNSKAFQWYVYRQCGSHLIMFTNLSGVVISHGECKTAKHLICSNHFSKNFSWFQLFDYVKVSDTPIRRNKNFQSFH